MKYINQNDIFSIHTTNTNNQDITLWEIQTPLRIMHEKKGEASHVIIQTQEGYIPLILANDWFIIFAPTEQILKLHITEPLVFFDEKQHIAFKKDDIFQIETNVKSLSKYMPEYSPLAILTLENMTSTICLNDKYKAISYTKDLHMPDLANSSHVSEYYNTDLDTTDQIFHHKKLGRVRIQCFNVNKWNEYRYIEYLDKDISQIQYEKPLPRLIYETPRWAKGVGIVLLTGLAALTINKCQNNEQTKPKTPQAVQIISNSPQAHPIYPKTR
ncbi:MAG: hypothetical protein IKV03_02805 [Alphaproteobacteria bacterium]|nr:hypothetical protein [Alphaproteobacteria bacterium]